MNKAKQLLVVMVTIRHADSDAPLDAAIQYILDRTGSAKKAE